MLSARLLLGVWAALLVLTLLTVGATHVDLGRYNIVLALFIALVKASLVALYFMHLRYDYPFHAIIFICTMLFVMLFIGLILVDALQYQADLIPGYAPPLDR